MTRAARRTSIELSINKIPTVSLCGPLKYSLMNGWPSFKARIQASISPGTNHTMTCTADELARFPYMIAVPADSGGFGKYFIERPEQLETFQRLVDYDHARYSLSDWYEVREFVPTPSNHYTSYRVITSPVGEILAAGLLYSEQSKDRPRRIEMELTKPPIDQHTNIWGACRHDWPLKIRAVYTSLTP